MLYLYPNRSVAKLVDYLEHLLWPFTALESALYSLVLGPSLLACWPRLGFLFGVSEENLIIWEVLLSCLLLGSLCELMRALIAPLTRWRNSFLVVVSALASAFLPERIADQIRPKCLEISACTRENLFVFPRLLLVPFMEHLIDYVYLLFLLLALDLVDPLHLVSLCVVHLLHLLLALEHLGLLVGDLWCVEHLSSSPIRATRWYGIRRRKLSIVISTDLSHMRVRHERLDLTLVQIEVLTCLRPLMSASLVLLGR